jgi:hypothetical protein
MGTATDPATAPFDTAGAAIDDDATPADDGDGDLYAVVHALIDGCVWRPAGPRVAAIAILEQPAIRAALRARDVVRALSEQHRPRQWGPGSDVVVCTAGCGAHPCATRALLDGGVK